MAGPEPMLLAIMPSCLSGFGGWGNSEMMGQHSHHFQQVVIWDSLVHLHCILGSSAIEGSSEVALVAKNLPAGAGDLRRVFDTAAHSSIVPRRIPWTEEPCMLRSIGSTESDQP